MQKVHFEPRPLIVRHTKTHLLPDSFQSKKTPGCLGRVQTQRESHPSIRVLKDQWLQLFEAETQASLLHPTKSKGVIRPAPIRQQRTEICLSISQELVQSILEARCNPEPCSSWPASDANSVCREALEGLSVAFSIRCKLKILHLLKN